MTIAVIIHQPVYSQRYSMTVLVYSIGMNLQSTFDRIKQHFRL